MQAVNHDFAKHFSSDWIDAWNAHDLERILSHYSDSFEMSSPIIIQLAGEASGRLAAEVFHFDSDGKVEKAFAHYAE